MIAAVESLLFVKTVIFADESLEVVNPALLFQVIHQGTAAEEAVRGGELALVIFV